MDEVNKKPFPNQASADLKDETESNATVFGDDNSRPNSPPNSPPHKPANDWGLLNRVQEQHEREMASGFKRQELGVTWRDLSVDVVSAEAAVNENVLSQFNIPQHIKESRNKTPLRTILNRRSNYRRCKQN